MLFLFGFHLEEFFLHETHTRERDVGERLLKQHEAAPKSRGARFEKLLILVVYTAETDELSPLNFFLYERQLKLHPYCLLNRTKKGGKCV